RGAARRGSSIGPASRSCSRRPRSVIFERGWAKERRMDDRTGATRMTVSSQEQSAYRGGTALRRRYPTIPYLPQPPRPHIPYFACECCDGGAGSDKGIARNWAALDAIELVPNYGVMPSLPSCEVELFGRHYAAPIGIAPMGGPALVWPGADLYMAQA